MDSSSSSTNRKTNLSVRNQTNFKKPSCSSSVLMKRRESILKKAYELSILCEVDVCVICYSRDGELTTWPQDKAKVRDMAERFSKLNDRERRKKSTNLSEFLIKKFKDEKNKDNNKFSDKVLEMEKSLEIQLRMLQDRFRLLSPNNQTEPEPEPLMNRLSSESRSVYSGFSNDLFTPSSSVNHPPSNFSILLFNHDNGVFTKLDDSSFDHNLATGYGYSDLLLEAQGYDGLINGNNIHLPMVIPSPLQLQTQNPLLQYATWNQTPSSFRSCSEI